MKSLFLLACLATACLSEKLAPHYQTPVSPLKHAPRILEMVSEHHAQQGYRFRFSSDDGIAREESASYSSPVTGSYSYTSPEGVDVRIEYIADENGFRVNGLPLPTAVPTEYPTPAVPSTESPKHYDDHNSGQRAPISRDTIKTNSEKNFRIDVSTSPLGYSHSEERVVKTDYAAPGLRSFTPHYQAAKVGEDSTPELSVTESLYSTPEVSVSESVYAAPEVSVSEPLYSTPEVSTSEPVYAAPEVRLTEPVYSTPEVRLAEPAYQAPEVRIPSYQYGQTEPELRILPVDFTETQTDDEQSPVIFVRRFRNFGSKYN